MDEKKLAWRGARRGKEQRVLRRGGLRLSGQRKGLQQQGQVQRWRGRQEFREPGPGSWLLDYKRSVVDGGLRPNGGMLLWFRRECDLEPGGHWASEAMTGSIQYQVAGDKAWSQGLM